MYVLIASIFALQRGLMNCILHTTICMLIDSSNVNENAVRENAHLLALQPEASYYWRCLNYSSYRSNTVEALHYF